MGCCFVPGCKSGYHCQRKEFKKLGKKNPSLFSCITPEELEKWNRAIPRADKQLTAKDKVCELHFDVNSIERYYTHKFPDGSIQTLERGRALLKPGSIPTIFPNLPDRFSKKSQKRKPPVERVTATKKIKEMENFVIHAAADYTEQQSDGFNLKDNIQFVKLLNQWWLIHSFPNYVACARFNDTYGVDRKVYIKDDNSVKVFLYDCDIQTEEKVSCVQDLSIILQKVDNYTECPGVTNRCSTKCLGYIPTGRRGRKSTCCKGCRMVRKQEIVLAKRQYASKLLYRSRNLYQRVVLAKKKCTRLKQKVIKLKNEINNMKSKCAAVEVETVKNMLLDFPLSQQEAVGACIEAAKKKGGTGQRYTIQWIYECLLIRIKSRKVYQHLRSHKILALPCAKTLNRYVKKIKGAYGFQSAIFDLLKEKADHMDKSWITWGLNANSNYHFVKLSICT